MAKKYGFSFSAKRALGVSSAKSKLSKSIGVPLTKQGRQRKVGQLTGCAILPILGLLILSLLVII
jgi:hypothetical protein